MNLKATLYIQLPEGWGQDELDSLASDIADVAVKHGLGNTEGEEDNVRSLVAFGPIEEAEGAEDFVESVLERSFMLAMPMEVPA